MPSFSGIEVMEIVSSGPVLDMRVGPGARGSSRDGSRPPPKPVSPNPSPPSPESRKPPTPPSVEGYSPQLGGPLATGGSLEGVEEEGLSEDVVKLLVVLAGTGATCGTDAPFDCEVPFAAP